jgi:lysophospholipase II
VKRVTEHVGADSHHCDGSALDNFVNHVAMSAFPAPHVILSTSLHTHTIILLHGRGSNGPEFAQELFEARTSKGLTLQEHLPGWKWVFPSSQTRFSTLFEQEMEEWFDIYSLTDPTLREELQTQGLQQSVAFICQLIEEEVDAVGGDAQRVVLGGISQGCATAVRAMLSSRDLGAFVGFCSWMPFPSGARYICSSSRILALSLIYCRP